MRIGLNPAELAAWVQAGAVVLAVAAAVWQILEARRTRRQEARAYVVVLFDVHADRMSLPDLAIANLGRTAARDITVSYTPELQSHTWDSPKAEAFFRGGIAMLAPGQRLATVFDNMSERPKDWDDRYEAHVAYTDTFGKRHRETFVLDLGTYRGIHYVDRKSVHHVHEQMKKLVTEVRHLREGFGAPMPVRVRSERRYQRDEWLHRRFRPWLRQRQSVPDTFIVAIRTVEWLHDEARSIRDAVARTWNDRRR